MSEIDAEAGLLEEPEVSNHLSIEIPPEQFVPGQHVEADRQRSIIESRKNQSPDPINGGLTALTSETLIILRIEFFEAIDKYLHYFELLVRQLSTVSEDGGNSNALLEVGRLEIHDMAALQTFFTDTTPCGDILSKSQKISTITSTESSHATLVDAVQAYETLSSILFELIDLTNNASSLPHFQTMNSKCAGLGQDVPGLSIKDKFLVDRHNSIPSWCVAIAECAGLSVSHS